MRKKTEIIFEPDKISLIIVFIATTKFPFFHFFFHFFFQLIFIYQSDCEFLLFKSASVFSPGKNSLGFHLRFHLF